MSKTPAPITTIYQVRRKDRWSFKESPFIVAAFESKPHGDTQVTVAAYGHEMLSAHEPKKAFQHSPQDAVYAAIEKAEQRVTRTQVELSKARAELEELQRPIDQFEVIAVPLPQKRKP